MKKLLASIVASSLVAMPAHGATLFNGHFYEYVSGSFNWAQALAGAATATPIAGYSAHLVTITSAAEDAFVSTTLSGDAEIWLAGSDAAAEGVWQWVAGPETGQIFYGPGAPSGSYSNWNSGEPNDFLGEDYLQSNAFGPNWNDISATYTSGYVVEYSPLAAGVPEPATWAMMIIGFGAVGYSLRRRRNLIALATA